MAGSKFGAEGESIGLDLKCLNPKALSTKAGTTSAFVQNMSPGGKQRILGFGPTCLQHGRAEQNMSTEEGNWTVLE